MSKASLGQFYTANAMRILDGITLETKLDVVEPFAGGCDLLPFIIKSTSGAIILYDIDAKRTDYKTGEKVFLIKQQDTLLNPPDYKNKWVITNPPYLAKNKSKSKEIFQKYGVNDLYEAFLQTIIDGNAAGGILILPLNFISSDDSTIRRKFFAAYNIERINIFLYQTFPDTTINVIAFKAIRKPQTITAMMENMKINGDHPTTQAYIYTNAESKAEEIKDFQFLEKTGYKFGGEIEMLGEDEKKINIGRLTAKTPQNMFKTKIYAVALDSSSPTDQIRLEWRDEPFIGKMTDRNFATLVSSVEISEIEQKRIITEFNTLLKNYRDKYHSLFLSNFRDRNRKRISFTLIYSLVRYLLTTSKKV